MKCSTINTQCEHRLTELEDSAETHNDELKLIHSRLSRVEAEILGLALLWVASSPAIGSAISHILRLPL